MRMRHCQSRGHRPGMTLVEVVVGLMLLASLGVGTLLACGAHQRQLQRASERMEAVEIADQLLASWYASGQRLPRAATGQIQLVSDRWIWQTRVIRQARVESLPVEVVRLELSRLTSTGARRHVSSVDLLAPVPQQVARAP